MKQGPAAGVGQRCDTSRPSPLQFPLRRWLRLQGTLKEHHEALQLALEVAAFLQQADALLGAIHAKVPASHSPVQSMIVGEEHPALVPCVEAAADGASSGCESGGTEPSVGWGDTERQM